ncbi:MAG: universal stress protein [Cytophagales bacterium]|nr:universal stress protein [Cytophagales bacterium]
MQISNILVPIDFSKCAKNALRAAIVIAKKSNAKIIMVNAVHVHSPHPEITGGLIEEIVSDYEDQVKQSFQELESEIIELKDVPHEADRFIAYLTDAIYTETQNKAIDLIVMGTRAEHSEMEHLLGTRASDVIQAIPVPILVIPESYEGFDLKKVGLAIEYDSSILFQDFNVLKMLCMAFDAELLAFNVSEDPSKISIEDQKLIGKLKDYLVPTNSSVRTVEASSITEGIKGFVSSHELNMLAMIPKKYNFFERLFKKSVTKAMAVDLDVPLLVIRES